MTNHRLTFAEHFELLEQQRGEKAAHREMLPLWLKPRIKRISGAWYCEARGVVGHGFSPAAAYSIWLISVRMMDMRISYQDDPWRMKPSFTLESRGAV